MIKNNNRHVTEEKKSHVIFILFWDHFLYMWNIFYVGDMQFKQKDLKGQNVCACVL